jgi:uncharacterized protein (DUF362 family)
MAKNKPAGLSDYQKEPLKRRDFIIQGATAVGIASAAAYLVLAPENFPLSLKDESGLRSQPTPEVFQLPDFRVAKPTGGVDVGIGRTGEMRTLLKKALDAIGGITHYIKPGDVVLVKPNVAFDRAPHLGATTHPDIMEALVQMLLVDCRAAEVRVTDNPIESPADSFAKSGVRKAVEQAGGQIYLPDSNAFRVLSTPGAKLIENWPSLYRPFNSVNKVIGVAAVKDHNLCQASLGIKNWYGLLGGQRNQFHQDIHEIISDLSLMIRPTLSILDGTRMLMRHGPTGGNPADVKKGNSVIVGTDPVGMDAWAYKNLLEREDELPAYLHKSEEKGTGKIDLTGRLKEVV